VATESRLKLPQQLTKNNFAERRSVCRRFTDINDHDFNSRVTMGLDIYTGSYAGTRQGYEYLVCGSTCATGPVDILHQEHPRILLECYRGRIMDSNAMVR
jgi:hypothetical protein